MATTSPPTATGRHPRGRGDRIGRRRPGRRIIRRTRHRHLGRHVDADAVRDLAPVTGSVVPFAMVIGVTMATTEAVPDGIGLLAGPLIYDAGAHLAAVTQLADGNGMWAAVSVAVLINARLLIYGAAIGDRFQGQPTWFRWLAVHTLVDPTFAFATSRPELRDPARFRRYWLTAGAVLGVGYTAAMAAGVLLGPAIPADSPLNFAAPATFVGLLMPHMRARRNWLTVAVSAGVGVVAAPLPGGAGLVLAIVTAMAVRTATDGRSS